MTDTDLEVNIEGQDTPRSSTPPLRPRPAIQSSFSSKKSLVASTKHDPPIQIPADRKIAIRFRPIGGAPALVNVGLCRISANERWSAVIKFLSRRLLPSRDRNRTETVFCYIANSFAPSPDSQVGNVFDSYQIDDELMVSYCLVQAFG